MCLRYSFGTEHQGEISTWHERNILIDEIGDEPYNKMYGINPYITEEGNENGYRSIRYAIG